MVSFAEELVLLALDDEKGTFINMSLISFEYALAGAILMDLALMNRIDTDLKNLMLVDDAPTGDELFDCVIGMIKEVDEQKSPVFWVREIRNRIENLRELMLDKLIERGILKREEHKILWVFNQRRYPVIDDREEQEVKTRIRALVLSDDIPDPRDIVLVSLINCCNMVDEIFTRQEQKLAYERIYQISRMDLIGQAVSKSINELQQMITSTVHMM
jgi:hypothetical protein